MIPHLAALVRLAAPLQGDGDPGGDMVDIFRRKEFDRSPGWWSRMWASIRDFFGGLSFSWLGPVGQFVLWLLLVVAVIALGFWLHRRWQAGGLRWRRRKKQRDVEPADIVPIGLDEISDPGELAAVREAFEEELDYKQAILFRYRELVATLMAARLVSNERGRTTGELRVDLTRTVPGADAVFDEASRIFEVTWYSDHPPTREEYERLDAMAVATTDAALPSTAGATR